MADTNVSTQSDITMAGMLRAWESGDLTALRILVMMIADGMGAEYNIMEDPPEEGRQAIARLYEASMWLQRLDARLA